MPGESHSAYVRRVVREKSQDVCQRLSKKDKNAVVLTADTVVISPNGKKLLLKPMNKKDAEKMLRSLSGKSHVVMTGYCISYLSGGKRKFKTRLVRTRVELISLTSGMIQRYIKTGEPMDKAGAYGIQGAASPFVKKVSGSYSNVVGLPLAELSEDLKAFGMEAP